MSVKSLYNCLNIIEFNDFLNTFMLLLINLNTICII